ncbi:MAG TPA: sulfite exporter TauE/SafE family protein [Gammaproteobacteria bacterium]|nr:sulfite exporter TauE/SafE family protein [Gammaproteobacteria bacterium]
MTDPVYLLLLFAAGIAAGVINTSAGGGSMLTVPVMIFLGMDPLVANGTNRFGIIVQNAVAIEGFRRRGFGYFGTSLKLGLWALPGALIGAWLAAHIDADLFQRILSIVLVMSALSLLLPAKRDAGGTHRPHWLLAGPALFGIGLYGGFVQVGVGILLMLGLKHLLRLDLLRVNVHKVFIVLIYTLPALAIYAAMGQVDWLAGAVLAVGNAIGAWLGIRLAMRGGEKLIRWIVAAAVIAMGIKLLLGR